MSQHCEPPAHRENEQGFDVAWLLYTALTVAISVGAAVWLLRPCACRCQDANGSVYDPANAVPGARWPERQYDAIAAKQQLPQEM